MQLPVRIEAAPDRDGYIARLGDPFDVTARGLTPQDALIHLRDEFQRRVAGGMVVATLVVPPPPIQPAAGWLPDDELTQEWLDAVERYRREADAEDCRRIMGEPPAEKEAS